MRLAKDSNLNDKDNNEILMFLLEKAKQMLVNNFMEVMKLYFESLGF